ncbi:c-type cytochrome [Chitinophaga nivalis]|uniref:Cytochrome c n=1 Tax=Chitinophaga nivalis TaxID=2991709 RepID=A0ABT3II01_9BACT|nr:cytochrome c [Chitinophaga nivalis]MCW3466728.1 cytochrome c [Chitinophaga nivalis]MCW3483581.1 cytochrome c [Chitinophaga nivalis]
MMALLQTSTPVPRDIPLALPLPEWALVVLLVLSFLLHLIFVNLMLGGSILTLWAQIKGLKNREYDILAHEIAKTITVNKSLAVVLGVAPLLSINTLYTVYFYSANALTGLMWISIIPLVTLAFLLTYLHKYTWHQLENNKPLHITFIAAAVLVFLFIPLIFLVNINLMLFPEKWGTIKGFVSALLLPNVFPRYLHFICASLAVTGLFLFWYTRRKRYPFETYFTQLTRYDVQKKAYSLTLAASLLQLMIGPIVLITLPAKGVKWNLIVVIAAGAAIALPAMWRMWKAITGPPEDIQRHFGKVVIAMTLTVLFMGSGRHIYRANALATHRQLVAEKTTAFEAMSATARSHAREEQAAAAPPAATDPVAKGTAIFKMNCSACHHPQQKLIGPPVKEMAGIYANDREGLKKWIKAPGKKRAGYPQMPGFPQLSAAELDELSQYILSVK